MAIDKIVAEYRLELDGLRQDVNNLKGQLKSVDDSVNKSADNTNKKLDDIGNNVGGKLPEHFKRLGAAIAAAFAVERITNFAVEAVNLAAKAEGIKRAFDKLNQPNLLDELRTATKGTVSDLQLMTTAVKASNFKLPLDQLARLLKFAQQRAIETGESIDYLVESIVLGISRKSIPILDNLGISATEVQAEFAKTGDMAVAVGNIIDKSMTDAGDATLTMAERQAQLRTSFENLKEDLGTLLIPVFEGLITVIQGSIDKYTELFNRLKSNTNSFQEEYAQTIEYAKQHEFTLDQLNAKADLWNRKMNETSGKESELYQARRDAYNDLIFQLEKSGQTQLKNTTNASNATSNQIGLLEQLKQEIDALTELQNKSNDPAEIKNYTIEIDKLQNRIKELTTVNNGNNKSQEDTNKTLQENIKSLQEYNAELVKLGLAPSVTLDQALKYFEEYDALNKTEQEKEIDAVNKKYEKLLAGADLYGADRAVILRAQEAELKALKDKFAQEEKDKEDKLNEERLTRQKKAADDRLQAEEEALRKQQEKVQSYFNAISGLASGFNELSNSLSESRIAQLDWELDKGLISQEQYDDDLKKIQIREAKREKAIRIFQATIGAAQSLINATTSVPFNPFLVGLVAATNALQLAAIAASPIPAFKDGVIDLKGKGTETSDSNLALLSKGESVMTAKETRKYKPVLEAIRKDRFEDYIMKVYLKQIQGKNKEANSTLDEWLYRSYLAQQKLISATEKQGDKVSRAVREIPKRHRWQA